MPGKVRLTVTGTPQIAAALARLAAQADEIAAEAAREWAQEIQDTARALAPVDTGTLRDAIEVRVQPGSTTETAQVGVWRADAYYAKFVEAGRKGQDADPFLHPAAEAHRRAGRRHVRAALDRRLP